MRTIKFIITFLIAAVVVVLCFANSADVAVRIWPDMTEYGVAPSPEAIVPLFIFGLAAGLLGFLLGAAREWAREHDLRVEGRRAKHEADVLKAKVDNMTRDDKSDIPALQAR